jgi:hypothetical protein
MGNVTAIVVGAVIALLGLVFFLQGIDLLKGSGMSGTVTWSVLGPLICVGGLALVRRGLRGRSLDG